MDNLAWHERPVWESDFIIRVDLAKFGMADRFEQLWVKRIGDQQFQVCSIPFFPYGVSLGDIVQTDDDFTLRSVVTRSGRKKLRIAILIDDAEKRIFDLLQRWVTASTLLYEWYARDYLAVDLPPEMPEHLDVSMLEEMSRSRQIEFEID